VEIDSHRRTCQGRQVAFARTVTLPSPAFLVGSSHRLLSPVLSSVRHLAHCTCMARWGQMPFGSNTHQGGLRRLGCINRGKTRFERGLSMHPTGRPANFDTTRPATQAHEPEAQNQARGTRFTEKAQLRRKEACSLRARGPSLRDALPGQAGCGIPSSRAGVFNPTAQYLAVVSTLCGTTASYAPAVVFRSGL
jgi:hypothetical protein